MNRFILIMLIFLIIISFATCKSIQQNKMPGESIELINTFGIFRKSVDSPNVIMPQKAWYQDSIGITEVCRINFVETDTTQFINISTTGYRYVNLKKKWAYEYTSLADTASIKRKFRYYDTTRFSGGWNFVKDPEFPVDSFTLLTDTIIKKVNYKRYKIIINFKSGKSEGICWFRCDNKNTYFKMGKSLSEKVGCMPVLIRTYPIDNPVAIFDTEIKFIANYLPDSIQRIFTAWKKNETKFPVQ